MSEQMDDTNDLPADGQRHGAGTYQMLWDCRFCGTEKLLGVTHRHCPNCGAAQDPAWRYLPAEADMVALEDHKFVGVDKRCPACNQPNSAASAFCQECGADLSGAAEVEVQARRFIGEGHAEADTKRDVVKDEFEAEMARAGVTAAAPSGKKLLGLSKTGWWIAAGVAIAIAVIAGIIYAVTYRKATSGSVVELTWERTIEIERFQQVSGSDWDESVPGDAYSVKCEQKQRGTEKYQTGTKQECEDVPQGDGSFKRECKNVPVYSERPVYDQWCKYTVDRWIYERKVSADGAGFSPAPYWPDYSLASGGLSGFGQERQGDRHEVYTVVINAEGERHACDFDEQAQWQQYPVGTPVTLNLYITGGADCDSLAITN